MDGRDASWRRGTRGRKMCFGRVVSHIDDGTRPGGGGRGVGVLVFWPGGKAWGRPE